MEESELERLVGLIEFSDQTIGADIREITGYVQFIKDEKISITDEDMDELQKIANGIVQALSGSKKLLFQMGNKVISIAQPPPVNP